MPDHQGVLLADGLNLDSVRTINLQADLFEHFAGGLHPGPSWLPRLVAGHQDLNSSVRTDHDHATDHIQISPPSPLTDVLSCSNVRYRVANHSIQEHHHGKTDHTEANPGFR